MKDLLVFLFLFVSSSAQASWSGFHPVYEVYTNKKWGGLVFLKLDPTTAHINPDGCSSTSHLKIEYDQPNLKKLYTMALTAQAAGNNISVYIDGCGGAYPKVTRMRMRTN